MQDVIDEAIRLLNEGETFVLATLVRTKGMTPQKAGAKQIFRLNNTSIGTLGGGCVEGDVWHHAQRMLKDKSPAMLRSYKLSAGLAAKDGLVCGGTMEFLIEPLWTHEDCLPMLLEIQKARKSGSAVTQAAVIDSRDEEIVLGQRLLVFEDGRTLGKLDFDNRSKLVKNGQMLAPTGNNQVVEFDKCSVYLEAFTTQPRLILLGGGHVSNAVYQAALPLGFDVIVIDDRQEFANKERFPQAEAITGPYDKVLAELEISQNTYILVATRGHRYDDLATQAAISTSARYIGLLGSRRKNVLIFKSLLKKGIPLERIKQIRGPVGLDIGALTPEELAISIISEIILCMRGGSGLPMKMDADKLDQLFGKICQD